MKGIARWFGLASLAFVFGVSVAGCANTWEGAKEDLGFGDDEDVEEVVE